MTTEMVCRVHGLVWSGNPIPGCAGCNVAQVSHEARERAIRAVVAAQWGVACALDAWGYEREARYSSDNAWDIEKIAALPTAEQIVDGTA